MNQAMYIIMYVVTMSLLGFHWLTVNLSLSIVKMVVSELSHKIVTRLNSVNSRKMSVLVVLGHPWSVDKCLVTWSVNRTYLLSLISSVLINSVSTRLI